MKTLRLTTIFTTSAAAFAFGAAMFTAPVSAHAAEEGKSLESKIIGGLLEGIGLRKDGEAINYQERAPLVIPPSRDLPPPETSGALIANNPAWPKDPDVTRRKQEEAFERNRNVSEEREREQNRLSEKELTPGGNPRTPPSPAKIGRAHGSNHGDFADRMTPSELGYKGGLFGFGSMFGGGKDDETAKFTGEPPRNSLTEPPPGYQTPSPDQPYGLASGSAKPKAFDYYKDRSDPALTR
jgi:hypothetical protein